VAEFWPAGLDLDDTSSPLEILEMANQEWAEHTSGLLALVIQEAESTNGNHLLIVHAKHVPSNRTVTLFSVVHRPGAPYPATILPRDNELPDILKKSYYRPGFAEVSAGFRGLEGRRVENDWVSDTPSEFRSQLRNVFKLGILKSEVLSLVSGAASSSRTGDETGNTEDASDCEPPDAGS
jgi:hypothetical protein